MGLSLDSDFYNHHSEKHYYRRKIFLLTNYTLLGSACSCIFLTLSLRLVPSLVGVLLILLHLITIAGAISGCAAVGHHSTASATGLYGGAHMAATVLTAIFQGSVAVLIFTSPSDFLGHLRSYVREEDAVVILRLAGGLCAVMFCLEWVVLTLAFFLNYFAGVEERGGGKVANRTDDMALRKSWPWPFQV